MAWSVCSAIPPATRTSVFGSVPILPARKIKPLAMIACEYGPMTFGESGDSTALLPLICPSAVKNDAKNKPAKPASKNAPLRTRGARWRRFDDGVLLSCFILDVYG